MDEKRLWIGKGGQERRWKMKRNVGSFDRIIRGILGALALVGLFLVKGTALQIVLGIVGIVLILTAIFGLCPLYSLLGINTCGIRK